MLALLISKQDWTGEDKLIGQLDDKVVVEFETYPEIEYIDITDMSVSFEQRCLDIKYGKFLSYLRVKNIRALILEVGDADSYEDLLQKKIDKQTVEIQEIQDAIIELDGGV